MLQEALTQVISEMLARNRPYFGGGGPGYYGVEVTNLSSDGCDFDLTLTFKAGVRYCCFQALCHVPLNPSSKNAWFGKIRERLKATGNENVPTMTIRRLHVVVEQGAISVVGPRDKPYRHECRTEHDEGPFKEECGAGTAN
jgi:hypothetical protein